MCIISSIVHITFFSLIKNITCFFPIKKTSHFFNKKDHLVLRTVHLPLHPPEQLLKPHLEKGKFLKRHKNLGRWGWGWSGRVNWLAHREPFPSDVSQKFWEHRKEVFAEKEKPGFQKRVQIFVFNFSCKVGKINFELEQERWICWLWVQFTSVLNWE